MADAERLAGVDDPVLTTLELDLLPTWPITCGTCGRDVSAEVVSGWASGVNWSVQTQRSESANKTLRLKCPNEECGESCVKLASGTVYPPAPFGSKIAGLPDDVANHVARGGDGLQCGRLHRR